MRGFFEINSGQNGKRFSEKTLSIIYKTELPAISLSKAE